MMTGWLLTTRSRRLSRAVISDEQSLSAELPPPCRARGRRDGRRVVPSGHGGSVLWSDSDAFVAQSRERRCEEFVASRTASVRIPRHAVLPPVRCCDPCVLRAGRRQGLCSRSSMTRRLIGQIGCRPCKQHPRRRRRRPHATSSDAAVPPNRLRRAQSSRRSRSK